MLYFFCRINYGGSIMKSKILKRTTGFMLAAVLLFSIAAPCAGAAAAESTAKTDYPYVYVHGLFGWGQDEGIDGAVPYWGATSCDLMKELNRMGYESYAASVGPLSSCWDRVCELYAQITGTRVDYGEAHSAAHNHSRYGRDYSEPMIEGWGEPDENGNIKKINLVGHSFGGATVRMFTYLMEYGSSEEQAATEPDDLSPLFAGGKGNRIHSVTTLCSPNNGTTLAYIFEEMDLATLAEAFCFLYAGMMGRSELNGFVDFHLEQFGLTYIPGEGSTPEESFKEAFMLIMTQNDKAMNDLFPEGAEKINDMIDVVDGVYYFSYAYQCTKKSSVSNNQVPTLKTLPVLIPFSMMMGAYSKNRVSDYPIDETWLANDGMVNVVSALHPDDEPYESFASRPGSECETGVWYVMPVREGHHGTVIGLSEARRPTVDFYRSMTALIDTLPATD